MDVINLWVSCLEIPCLFVGLSTFTFVFTPCEWKWGSIWAGSEVLYVLQNIILFLPLLTSSVNISESSHHSSPSLSWTHLSKESDPRPGRFLRCFLAFLFLNVGHLVVKPLYLHPWRPLTTLLVWLSLFIYLFQSPSLVLTPLWTSYDISSQTAAECQLMGLEATRKQTHPVMNEVSDPNTFDQW